MLEKSTEHKDLLVNPGDVGKLLGDLEVVAAEIAEQVRLLDGMVRYQFGENAELMGAWAQHPERAGAVQVPDRARAGRR